jgi:hypothetical protein
MIGDTCIQCNNQGKACVPVTDLYKIITSEAFHFNAPIRSYHQSIRIAVNESLLEQLRHHLQGAIPSIFTHIRSLEECVRVQGATIKALKQQIETPPTMQTPGYTPIQQNDSRSNGDM